VGFLICTVVSLFRIGLRKSTLQPLKVDSFTSGNRPLGSDTTHLEVKDKLPLFNDISWLDYVTFPQNPLIGRGLYTFTFAMDLNIPSKTEKDYVLKITGLFNGTGAKGSGKASKRALRSYQVAVEMYSHLSPHKSIPETLFYIENIPNPLLLQNDTSLSLAFNKGIQQIIGPYRKEKLIHAKEKIQSSANVSIIAQERIYPSHTINRGKCLLIPKDKIRCFWRRLFEAIDYAHSRNVMMIDISFPNVLIQDGEIILFDWNTAEFFEPNGTKYEWMVTKKNKNFVYSYDVSKLGKLIGYYLKCDTLNITKSDVTLLKKMNRMMIKNYDSHSLQWYIQNHKYFTTEKDEECDLNW